jgi:hypothetical protein
MGQGEGTKKSAKEEPEIMCQGNSHSSLLATPVMLLSRRKSDWGSKLIGWIEMASFGRQLQVTCLFATRPAIDNLHGTISS